MSVPRGPRDAIEDIVGFALAFLAGAEGKNTIGKMAINNIFHWEK